MWPCVLPDNNVKDHTMEKTMCKHLLKKFSICLFVAVFVVLTMNSNAGAGPLSIKVTKSEAGGVSDSKQGITFSMTVKNTSSHEFIRSLNFVEAEITGDLGNDRETYKRKIDVNYTFNPPLGPGDSKKLTTRFKRKVNPDKGWYKYRKVKIRVLKCNFSRAS